MYEEVKKYLLSDDMEMVQLGAVILQETVNRNKWNDILNECSRTPIDEDKKKKDEEALARGEHIWSLPYSREKWFYRIDHDKITVTELGKGLWEQLANSTTTSTGSYKIRTGAGGMKLLNEAMKNYKNPGKKTIRNQVKHK